MTIRLRFTILILIITVVFALGLVVHYMHQYSENLQLLQSARRNHTILVNNVIQMSRAQMRTFVVSQSRRDEMNEFASDNAAFLTKYGQEWAKANIDPATQRFDMDAIWVYDPQGRLLHFTPKSTLLTPSQVDFLKNLPKIAGVSGPALFPSPSSGAARPPSSRNFFLRSPIGLVEIRAAAIQSASSDPDRWTQPGGYLLAGHVWDKTHLDELGSLLGSAARITEPKQRPSAPVASGIFTTQVAYEEEFQDANQHTIGVLHILSPYRGFEQLNRHTATEALASASFAVAVITACLIGGVLWVDRPMRCIRQALRQQNYDQALPALQPILSAPSQGMRSSPPEYQELSQLVLHSLQQQQALRTGEARARDAEAHARASEARFERIATNVPGMVYQFVRKPNGAGSFTFVSAGAQRLFGLAPKVIQQDSARFFELIHPKDQESFTVSTAAARNSLTSWEWEGRFLLPHGEIKWVRAAARPDPQENGDVIWDGILIDQTQEHQAHETLRRQQEFLRNVLDTSPDIVFVKDANGVFTLVNHALAEIYGTTVEELTGKCDADFNSDPAIVEAYRADDRRTLASLNETFVAEEPIPLLDGTIRWMQTRKRPIPSPDGTAYQVLGIGTDITARKQAEAEREASRQQLRQVLTQANCLLWQAEVREAYPDGTPYLPEFALDRGTRLTWDLRVVNEEEVLRWLPIDRQDGEPFYAAWDRARHPGDYSACNKRSRTALLSNAGRYLQTFRTFVADGSIRWLQEDVRIEEKTPTGEDQTPPLRHWRVTGVVTDITERVEAEERLQHIVDSSRCAFWSAEVTQVTCLDTWTGGPALSWKFQYLDKDALRRLLPSHPASADSDFTSPTSRAHPEDRVRMHVFAASKIQRGEDYFHEFRMLGGDGAWYWFSETVRVQEVGPGRWRTVGVITDISDRKRAEEHLRYVVDSARCLLWSAEVTRLPNAVGFTDTGWDWRFLHFDDDAAQRFLPLTVAPGQHYSEALWHSIPPKDQIRRNEYGLEMILRNENYSQEFRVCGADGEWYWVHEAIHVEAIGPDKWRVAGVYTDATENKRAEERLRESEERFRSAIDSMQEGLMLIDSQGVIRMCNAAAERIVGRSAAEMDDCPLQELDWVVIQSDGSPATAETYPLHIALREGRVAGGVLLGIYRPDGSLAWMLINAAPLFHPGEEKPYAAVATFADVTEMRTLNEALVQRNDSLNALTTELQRSNGALQEFAYVASHDLKEPLRKIQAFGGMLQRKAGDTLNPAAQDYVDRMCSAAARMQILIEGLLAFSRVSSRPRELAPVNLNQVAAGVLNDLETRTEESSAQIEVGPLPTVYADDLQMRQLLQNLIGNALKFRKAEVAPRITVQAEPITESDEWITLRVTDNGIGFAPEYRERIFNIFERLVARDQGYEGTGVGLAICKKIAERHGGSIRAISTPGEGATFEVRLPRTPSAAAALPADVGN